MKLYVKMSESPKNPYAKKFPVNSSLHSSSKRNSPTRKVQETFKIVTDIRGGDIIDLDKPKKYGDHIKGSHKTKKLDRGLEEKTKDLKEKRRLTEAEAFEDCAVTKKVRHECYELEEVNDTGQCSDGSGEDAVETSDEDKVDEAISEEMETFNDLSETLDNSDLMTSDKWMAKVVAHDHDYYGSRVRFRDVTVWYFARHQYSASVPSQGDVAMGMEMKHIHREQISMDHIDQLSDSQLCKNKVNPFTYVQDLKYFDFKSKRKPRLGGRMKPLSMSARVSLLRSHGILQIDRRESANIEKLQVLCCYNQDIFTTFLIF